MKKRPQKPLKPKRFTFEELGIPNRDNVMNELWSTNNIEASEGIIAWVESPDCGRVAAEKILGACQKKVEAYKKNP